MSTQSNWFIRPYQEGDENYIFELRKAIRPERQYDKEQWLKWWHWTYKEIPHGSKIWLADDHGKLIGQYPLILTELEVGETTVKAAQNINVETHPDYRHQGIYTKLERIALDKCTEDGIFIIFGFPNDASYPGHIKSGWFEVSGMQNRNLVLNWEKVLRTRIINKFLLKLCAIFFSLASKLLSRPSKVPVVKGLSITQISSFDERINEFWTRISSQFRIIVIRSKDYLNWRYATVPDVKYFIYIAEKDNSIYGYIILRYHQEERIKVAVIYDLLAETEEIAQCLLHTAIEHCQKDGIGYIHWVGIANKSYLKAFRKRGFIHFPLQKGQKFLAYLNSTNISKDFIMNPQNWLIQTGDSDEL